MSPGRKPRLSPASTAGRTSTILPICFCLSDSTAVATARYVLPVPAGPLQNTRSFSRIAWTYSAWPRRPRANLAARLCARRPAPCGRWSAPPITCWMMCDTCSRRHEPVAADGRLDLLDDLGGLEDRLLVAADVNLAVAGRNFGRHGVADATQMLVAGAQQQHQFVRGADRNCRFDHQQTRQHLAAA